MTFLYHSKPDHMMGTVLFPLNDMQTTLPEIYKLEKAKYTDRESLMEEIIPFLNCKWNDVLHLSPIDPKIVYQELINAGFSPPKDVLFFKIPLNLINEALTVMYKYENEDRKIVPDQFLKFSKEIFENLSELPIGTKNWYKKCAESKKRPLLFHMVPHVLTKSSIDISSCEVFSWL